MKLLLDTHVFVWAKTGDRTLARQVQAAILDPNNDVYVSLATPWELIIKASLGKLRGDASVLIGSEEQFEQNLAESSFLLLPIRQAHIFGLQQLPHHHHDPFDRLIIAQAISERMTLVSVDARFHEYVGLDFMAAI